MSPTILAATESANPILPAVPEIIWSVISFSLLLVLLVKFAFPPIKAAMENRTAKIQGDIDSAESARREAERLLVEYREQLSEAKKEATRILEEARKTSEILRRDLLARAEEEGVELRARHAEALKAERERVVSEIRREMASLAIEIAEHVLRLQLDHDVSNALVEQYLSEIGAPAS